jgi:hypothetical protein
MKPIFNPIDMYFFLAQKIGLNKDLIGNRLRAGRPGVGIPSVMRASFFSKTSRPALWLTQPPIQWVPG